MSLLAPPASPPHPPRPPRPAPPGHRLWPLLALLLTGALPGCDVGDTESADGGPPDARRLDAESTADAEPEPEPDQGPPPCNRAADCAAPTPACFRSGGGGGVCVECTDSTFCPVARPVCGLDERCVPRDPAACREDLDCAAARPRCVTADTQPVGVCVRCASDAHCGGGTPRCDAAGRCVAANAALACTGDAVCGPRRLCVGGECVF